MFLLKTAGLVLLSNPKTAGRSLRSVLASMPDDVDFFPKHRHLTADGFHRMFRAQIAAELGKEPETFAVMRAPRDHMESWYRYRLRAAVKGQPASTRGISYPDFVAARLANPAPAYARIGRQDRFLGLRGGRVRVTHVFDYARLDLLVQFLSDNLGKEIVLPRINVSPVVANEVLILPEELETRYRTAHAAEFELYDKVAKAGVLVTRS